MLRSDFRRCWCSSPTTSSRTGNAGSQITRGQEPGDIPAGGRLCLRPTWDPISDRRSARQIPPDPRASLGPFLQQGSPPLGVGSAYVLHGTRSLIGEALVRSRLAHAASLGCFFSLLGVVSSLRHIGDRSSLGVDFVYVLLEPDL